MMSPELRARWSAALREPGRMQGYGQLRTMGGPFGETRQQCCLDVLIELYRTDNPDGLTVTTDRRGTPGYIDPDSPTNTYPETLILPVKVANWAGVSVMPRIGAEEAGDLNDRERLSFTEIADRIDDPGNTVS